MDPHTAKRPAWRVSLFPTAVAALALAAPGCGDDNVGKLSGSHYPVTGKVLMEDGKPLVGARVVLTDGVIAPSGEVGSDGTFKISTGDREGAPAGEYKVKIEPPGGPTMKNRKPVIPLRYADEDTSGLTATVKPGTNDLPPFTLSGKPDPVTQRPRDRD
jgi:hypothetical protein